jgi:dipeptidase E
MKKKLILGSYIGSVIDKLTFLFEKPLDQLKIVCIPTAANIYAADKKDWLFEEMKSFTDLGMKLTEFDILGKTEKEVADQIKDADIVYVTGGNTYYLIEQMQKCNFKSTIKSFLETGGFYIGSSAGMVVTCPTIDFIGDLDDPAKASTTDYSGLGLVDFKIFPHVDHPKYKEKIRDIIKKLENVENSIFGLSDNQALLITNNFIEMFQAGKQSDYIDHT